MILATPDKLDWTTAELAARLAFAIKQLEHSQRLVTQMAASSTIDAELLRIAASMVEGDIELFRSLLADMT